MAEREKPKRKRTMRRSATHDHSERKNEGSGTISKSPTKEKVKDDVTLNLPKTMNSESPQPQSAMSVMSARNSNPPPETTRNPIQVERDARIAKIVKRLKSGKVTEITLEKIEIDDASAKLLIDAIPKCETVKRITLRQNNLSTESARELVRSFCRHNHNIKQWTLRENENIDTRTLGKIVKMMVEPTFGVAEMDLGYTKYGPDEVGNLVEVLEENKLHALVIEGCPLGKEGCAQLMKGLLANTSVKKLHIGGINDFDIDTLCAFLKKSTILGELSLSYMSLTFDSFSRISSTFAFERPLTILDVSYTGMDFRGLQVLSRAIGKNSCVQQLNISGNPLSDSWADAIIPGIHDDLTQLTVSYCGLSVGLGRVIGATKLIRIQAKGNCWSLEEFSSISEALTVNKSLVYLGLSRCQRPITGEELNALSGGLSVNTTLTEMDLAANGIQDDDVKDLIVAVQVNRSLRKLRLVYNLLTPKAIMAFESTIVGDTQSLNKNEFIEVVDFIVDAHNDDPRWIHVNAEDAKKRKKLMQLTIEETVKWINTNSKKIFIRRKELQELDSNKQGNKIAAVTVWSPPGEARFDIPKEKILLKLTMKGATGTATRYSTVINGIDSFIKSNCSDDDWLLVFCEVRSKADWDGVINVVFREADQKKQIVWTCVTDQKRIPLLKVFGFEVTGEITLDGAVKLWGLTRQPKVAEEALPARHRPSVAPAVARHSFDSPERPKATTVTTVELKSTPSSPSSPSLAASAPTFPSSASASPTTPENVVTPKKKKRASNPSPSKLIKKSDDSGMLSNSLGELGTATTKKKKKELADSSESTPSSANGSPDKKPRKKTERTPKKSDKLDGELTLSLSTGSVIDSASDSTGTENSDPEKVLTPKRSKRAATASKLKSPITVSKISDISDGTVTNSEEEGNSVSGQSLYAEVITTAKTIIVNCNRVSTLCIDTINDIFDGIATAMQSLDELTSNFVTLKAKLTKLVYKDLKSFAEELYYSVETESGNVDSALDSLISFLRQLQHKQNHDKYKSMSSQERAYLVKSLYVSVNSTIKDLTAALEREKLSFESSDANPKKLEFENTSENSTTATTSTSEIASSRLTESSEKEIKLGRGSVSAKRLYSEYTPTRSNDDYDNQKITALQKFFKRNVHGATWRNLAKDVKETKLYGECRRRNNVTFELLSTEESYIKGLENVIEHYLKPLREELKSRKPLASKRDVTSIFSSIEIIYNINIGFLKKLRDRLKAWPRESTIGDLLNEALPAMKLYIDYVNNFDEATQTYQTLAQDKEFVDFMEDCRKTTTNLMDLPSLLITPIQRMPRYELLIRELMKSTNESHADYKHLLEAKKIIQKNNNTINAKKLEQENRKKLFEIEKSIVSNAPMMLLAPHRLLIRGGDLAFTHKGQLESNGHVFLMNDIMVLTKSRVEKDKNMQDVTKFVYVNTISVKNMVLKDSGKKLQFYIIQKPDIWEFYSTDEQTKKDWTVAVHDAIETFALNELLKAGVDESGTKGFSILKATYGILKDPTQNVDVTQAVRDIVKQQGGFQLVLNAGSKVAIFGDPTKNNRKELLLVIQVKGKINQRVFADTDAIKLPEQAI